MGRQPFLKRNEVSAYKIKFDDSEPDEPFKLLPGTLVGLLFDLHKAKGLEPTRPFAAYLREAKAFIELAGSKAPDILIQAAEYSNYPFTFKYIRRFYEKDTDTFE